MSTTLTANFHTREEADLVVERLVQEHGVERADIFISAAGSENSAGDELSGADTKAGSPSPENREDAPLRGVVEVSVDLNDSDKTDAIRDAFSEFNADNTDDG